MNTSNDSIMTPTIYKNKIRLQFIDYFGDISFTKLKSNGQFSMYYAKIGCLLCIDNKYLVVVVENDNTIPIGSVLQLSELPWVSFQCRTLEESLGVKLKAQDIKQKPLNPLFKSRISLTHKLSDRYQYVLAEEKAPLIIEILLTKDTRDYAKTGTIHSAINTYQCVIAFMF